MTSFPWMSVTVLAVTLAIVPFTFSGPPRLICTYRSVKEDNNWRNVSHDGKIPFLFLLRRRSRLRAVFLSPVTLLTCSRL